MRKIQTGLVLLMMLILSACSNEKALLPENVQRLSSGDYKDWKLDKVTYMMLNVTSQLPACQQDEIYRFYSDGRGEIRKGPNSCKPNEADVMTTGTWQFEKEGEILVVNWKKDRWELTVDELTEKQLKVTGKVFDSYVVTVTFVL